MDMAALADLRKSVRNFTDKPIAYDRLKELEEFFKGCKKLDNSIKTEIQIVTSSQLPEYIEKIGGYNGFLIGAPYYILIFSERKQHFIENAGYLGEDIILKMTDMEIDSCWLTLKQDTVLDGPNMDSSHDELRITGLIAAGYGKKAKYSKISWGSTKKPGTDNEIRMDLLDMVYVGDYGVKANSDQIIASGIAEAFYAARRAPSALNRQPWRFILDGSIVVLVIKKDEYTNIYEAKIAAGAAMFNFAAVISQRIFEAAWQMGEPDRSYNIPNDCVIAAYCNV